MPRWLRLYLLNTLHSARPPKGWLSPPCSPALPLTEAGPHECLLRRAVAEGQKRMESVTSHALGALSSMLSTTTEELAVASKQP